MTTHVTTLANGLRVATDSIPSVESVVLGVWVNLGASSEDVQINGVSHMLEHMAFKGTSRRTAEQIANEIESVGGHMNAYTSREQTAYHIRVLKEDIALAVDILADILQNSTFDPEEIERERSVILQEIGQSNDTPDDVVFDYFQETAYPNQALGRPILGTVESVSALTRDNLMSYMSHYHPNQMVFAAAGNVNHDDLVRLVEKAFGTYKGKGLLSPHKASYTGGHQVVPKDLEQVHILLGFQGLPYDDEDYYTASIYSMILGGGMSSRLFQEIREKLGLVYTVYSFTASYKDTGLFGVYAGTGRKEAAELTDVLVDELHKMTETIEDHELKRAKTLYKSSTLMSRESVTARCENLAQQLHILGRPMPLAELVEKIDGVQKADVLRIAKKLITSTPTLAATGPTQTLTSFDHLIEKLRK